MKNIQKTEPNTSEGDLTEAQLLKIISMYDIEMAKEDDEKKMEIAFSEVCAMEIVKNEFKLINGKYALKKELIQSSLFGLYLASSGLILDSKTAFSLLVTYFYVMGIDYVLKFLNYGAVSEDVRSNQENKEILMKLYEVHHKEIEYLETLCEEKSAYEKLLKQSKK